MAGRQAFFMIWALLTIASAAAWGDTTAQVRDDGSEAMGEGPQCVLTLEPGDGNPRNSEGDFIQLKDGRLLFVYTHFVGSSSDFGSAYLAGRHSDDGGRTWSAEDEVVLPNEGDVNTMSVSLLRLRSGEIALFYLRKNSKADCRCYMRISTDEGRTWSEPRVCIEPLGYYVVNNDRVIQLESGRLVVPAACHGSAGEDYRHPGKAMCYLSDDNGETWRVSTTILEPPEGSRSGLQEPGVVELKDGRVLMLCRTDQGCQYRSRSDDGGTTWSPAEPTDIVSPVSPASFERIPATGDLLLVWNDHHAIDPALTGKRTPLTVAVSQDEGQTWNPARMLENNPAGWYCYTAIAFVGDHILLGYCAGDTTIGGLNRTRIVRLPVTWLY